MCLCDADTSVGKRDEEIPLLEAHILVKGSAKRAKRRRMRGQEDKGEIKDCRNSGCSRKD